MIRRWNFTLPGLLSQERDEAQITPGRNSGLSPLQVGAGEATVAMGERSRLRYFPPSARFEAARASAER